MNQPFTHTTTNQHFLLAARIFNFSAKEKDQETSLFSYLASLGFLLFAQPMPNKLAWHSLIRRFGSRYYSSDLSIWLSVDPMSDKYPSLSPYVYCANNPIKLVDPNGEEIEVTANDNGTHTVVGGTLNNDRNIYIVKDGKRTGDVLGQTMTDYSFFNEEGNVVKGAVIDPTNNSGQDFLDGVKSDNPGLFSYMFHATHGDEKYDFKVKGGADDKNVNRGMPVKMQLGPLVPHLKR